MIKFKGYIFLVLILNLLGCDFGNPTVSNNKINSVNSNNQVNVAIANDLQVANDRKIKRNRSQTNSDLVVDTLGAIPVTQAHKKYLFRISNHSSKNYHLETLRIGDDDSNVQLDSDNVEVSAHTCKNLMAHASCSVQLETKTLSSANQTLEMEFVNDQGDTTQVNQLIRLDNNANRMTGFMVNLDDVNQVITTDGDYSLSVPVLLTENFTQIKALNGSLICSGNGFKKGNSCSYLVSGHALADNTLVGLELIGYQGNTKLDTGITNILVRAAAQANLVLSHGAELDPQSSHQSAEIMLHNTGTASATISNITVDAPLQIKANQCPAQLTADSSCKIIVKLANPSEQLLIKPSVPLIITYSSNNQTQQVGTNIYIKPQTTSAAALTLSNIQGGLTNTLLGNTSTHTIKIQNSGSIALNAININFSPKNGVSLFFPSVGVNGCPSSGKNISLAPNQSCTFQLKYTYNGGAAPNAVAQVVISGKAANGTSFRTNYITNYSGINDANLLSIDPIANLTVLANSTATVKSPFTLRNNLPEIPLTLNFLFLSSSISPLNIVAESCTNGTKLNTAKPSCSGVIQYGPQAPVQSSSAQLSVKFQAENANREREIKSNQFKVEARSDYLPLITTKFAIGDDKPLRFRGKGTVDDPYDFLALSWRYPLTLIYTFTNEGSAPAKNFRIQNLDETYIYFNSSPNSCGLDDGSVLLPGASCTLTATIASKNFLKLRAIPGIVSLKLPIIYSYGDQPNASYLIQDYELTRHIQFTRDWLNASYSYPSAVSPANNAWNLSITGSVDIDSAITDVEKNISVTLTPEGDVLRQATVSPCMVNYPNTSCVARIAFPQTNYISGWYFFNMKGRANWTSNENAIYQNVEVELK